MIYTETIHVIMCELFTIYLFISPINVRRTHTGRCNAVETLSLF